MRTTLLLINLLIALTVIGQDKSFDLNNWSKQEKLKHASIGISVVDLIDKKTIINFNNDLALAPASLTKIVTTATALELLGADYQIPTTIGILGVINAGVLQGNLSVKGFGDPTIESKYFASRQGEVARWADTISKSGITAINGDIVMTSENFSHESVSSRWIWEDMGNYYGSGVYPFSIRDNTYRVTFRTGSAGSKADIIRQSPEAANIDFKNFVVAANNNKDSAYIYGSPLSTTRTICGSIPANRKQFTIKGSVPNPPFILGLMIRSALKERGITVKGEVVISDNQDATSTIATFNSPTLRELIKETNHHSINLFADHIFWQLALSQHKEANNRNSFAVLSDFWRQKEMDISALKLWDGSGLSPQNTITPEFLTTMLSWINTNSVQKEVFIESLPKAGKIGTVKYFLSDTRLAGEVRLKSGSMDGVRCYAGYVNENGLPRYAFAIMINHFSCRPEDAIKAIEDLMLAIF